MSSTEVDASSTSTDAIVMMDSSSSPSVEQETVVMKEDVSVPEKEVKKTLSTMTTLKRLLRIAFPKLPYLTMGLVALGVNSYTNSVFPQLLRSAVDNVDDLTFLTFLQTYGGFFAAGTLASFVRTYCMGVTTDHILRELRRSVYSSILSQPMSFYNEARMGEMITLLSQDVPAAAEAVTDKISALLRSMVSSLVGSVDLYNVSPRLCRLALLVLPTVGAGTMTFSRYKRRILDAQREKMTEMTNKSLERVQNIQTVRLFGRESFELDSYNTQLDSCQSMSHRVHSAQGMFMAFTNISGNLALLAVLQEGGKLILQQQLTTGDLSSFAFRALFVGLGFSGLTSGIADLRTALRSAGRVFQLMDDTVALCEASSTQTSQTPDEVLSIKDSFGEDIVVRDLGYSYGSKKVFNNLSLVIPRNKITCFVGESGAGKSTLSSLLCGLLLPSSGAISYGNDTFLYPGASNSALQQVYNRFGVVLQSGATLMAGTIRENICYGKLDATDEEIEAAARLANAHDFIMSLPEGYNTQVGERGSKLSGGQAARVSIARALVKKPEVLLLDEPTAALDAANEQEIIGPLRTLSKNVTIIIFTHSDTLRDIADRLYTLSEGNIVQQ